ncbi:hypothetical protein VIGAN_02234400 [Vigna angularis var. angularis]|uniref:Uncharacterized protein n=1 Tax=Vigna angularis var. angularis TaxID=157739 RepID=A0A0S3RG32_PHAAN|nr:hypothetical protein VIGAN_02234400 [Vigna angularis var. angularis]
MLCFWNHLEVVISVGLKSTFNVAANGPSDLSSRYGSGGHSRRYSDPSQNNDASSGSNSNSRRTPMLGGNFKG